MKLERHPQPELDHCPNCRQRFEIAAVKLRVFREPAMLFVCSSCGLTQIENPNQVRVKIHDGFAALDRKLSSIRRAPGVTDFNLG
jgi:hypothetical protein